MNRTSILLAFILLSKTILAQQFYIKPECPAIKDVIHVEYDDNHFFGDKPKVTCVVYFTGSNDRSKQREDFPIARVVPLNKSGNSWLAKIDSIPPRSTAMVFVFMDSLSHRDSNKGKGYYVPFYSDQQPLPGAWAGVGTLLYGNWITDKAPFHIRYDLDSARKFLMKDFAIYPEVKREYFRQYIDALKINTPQEEQIYKKELEELAQFPDLTHAELLLLRFQYGRLKDTVSANKYERQLFEKYPSGSWTVQAKSLKQSMAIVSTDDFKKQSAIYQQFKTVYIKPYEDEFATLTMNRRAGQMLGYMVKHFANEGTMELWINEVEQLTDDGKSNAYRKAVRELLGLDQSEEPTQKATSKRLPVEHVFFINNIDGITSNVKITDDFDAASNGSQEKK